MKVIELIACLVYAVIGVIVCKCIRHRGDEDEPDDFQYLTVREQMAEAKGTSDAIGDMEQLETDIAESTADDVLILHIEWVSRDGQNRQYALYCDGENTASENIALIAERESHELRKLLAYQVDVLHKSTRSAKNRAQNYESGGVCECDDEAMPALRIGY